MERERTARRLLVQGELVPSAETFRVESVGCTDEVDVKCGSKEDQGGL